MKTLISIFLLVLFVPFQTNAQTDYNSIQLSEWGRGYQNIAETRIRSTPPNVEGTPFFKKDWNPGVVLLNENLKSESVDLLFDTSRNLVFFKKGDQAFAANSAYITGFYLTGKEGKLLFKNGFKSDNDEINSSTFLKVIHDDKIKLLAHHQSYIRESKTSVALSGTVENEYRHKEDYYLKLPDVNKLHKIRLKKKDLFKHIDEAYRKKLENYAEENDLDFGEEKELGNILGFYEQLIAEKR